MMAESSTGYVLEFGGSKSFEDDGRRWLWPTTFAYYRRDVFTEFLEAMGEPSKPAKERSAAIKRMHREWRFRVIKAEVCAKEPVAERKAVEQPKTGPCGLVLSQPGAAVCVCGNCDVGKPLDDSQSEPTTERRPGA